MRKIQTESAAAGRSYGRKMFFMIKKEDFKIRKATEEDASVLKKITDDCIAVDYYSEEYIRERINRKGHTFYVYTDEEDVPAAYLYIYTDMYKDAKEDLHLGEDGREIAGISEDTVVGVYKTACTVKEYRNEGILSMFLDKLEDVLKNDGAEYIVFTALKHPDGKVPVDHVVRKAGFKPVFEIEHPWIDMYLYCHYCGKHHCECNAVIYSKKLV